MFQRLFLRCPKCGRLTDLVGQLASSGIFLPDENGGLVSAFQDFALTTIQCDTPGCDGVWGVEIEETQWTTIDDEEHCR